MEARSLAFVREGGTYSPRVLVFVLAYKNTLKSKSNESIEKHDRRGDSLMYKCLERVSYADPFLLVMLYQYIF